MIDKDIVHTETYRDYVINIAYDDDDYGNPFEDWDGLPPIAVYSPENRGINEYSTKYGHVNEIPQLSEAQVREHWRDILALFNVPTLRDFIREAKVEWDSYYYNTDVGAEGWVKQFPKVWELVNNAIFLYVDSLYTSERLKTLEQLYRMAGMTALYRKITGYVQSDWAYVLAVATPEYEKEIGTIIDHADKLKANIQLFRDWAFGNVYGYEIIDPIQDMDVESCWGFYGDYDGPDGALIAARQLVDSNICSECDGQLGPMVNDASGPEIKFYRLCPQGHRNLR